MTLHSSCLDIFSEQNHNTAPTEAISWVVNMIHMYDSFQKQLKTNHALFHTCKLINLSNQPARFNQQEGPNLKTFT